MPKNTTQSFRNTQPGSKDTEARSSQAPGRRDIEALAHQLWVERGCPIGTPQDDWFRAEEQLKHGTEEILTAAGAA